VVVFRYPYVKARCLDCGWKGELDADDRMVCPVDQSTNLQLTRKNYIKRLVGLPGETLILRNGDLYVSRNGKRFRIARKPPEIQRRLWIPAFDSSYVPEERIRPRWEFTGDNRHWKESPESGALTCDASASQEPCMVRFARPVSDLYPYNGTQSQIRRRTGRGEYHLVGDLRLRLNFSLSRPTADPDAALLLKMVEDQRELLLSYPVIGGEATLQDNGRIVARRHVGRLSPGDLREISLANYDDRVEARLDGEVFLSYEYEDRPDQDRPRQQIAFGARATSVRFGRVRIDRDIYYIPRRGQDGAPVRYDLDMESYMVLGDNSPASSDSRAWPDHRVPAANLMGEAFAIFWPIHDIALLSIGSEPTRKGRR
jgi:signal peptidase I